MCQNMADRIRIPEDRNKCKDILIFLQTVCNSGSCKLPAPPVYRPFKKDIRTDAKIEKSSKTKIAFAACYFTANIPAVPLAALYGDSQFFCA